MHTYPYTYTYKYIQKGEYLSTLTHPLARLCIRTLTHPHIPKHISFEHIHTHTHLEACNRCIYRRTCTKLSIPA